MAGLTFVHVIYFLLRQGLMTSLIVLFYGIENLVPQLLVLLVLPGLILIVTLFLSFSQVSRVSAKDKGNEKVY